MKGRHPHIAILLFAVVIAALVTMVILRSPGEDVKMAEARLRAVFAEWQIVLPISNRVPTNYARTSSEREGAMDYFKLRIRKEESEAILADQQLARRFQFHQKAEFYNSAARSWWSAASGARCFWGTLDSQNKSSWITLFLVKESENDWLFIESFSGKH